MPLWFFVLERLHSSGETKYKNSVFFNLSSVTQKKHTSYNSEKNISKYYHQNKLFNQILIDFLCQGIIKGRYFAPELPQIKQCVYIYKTVTNDVLPEFVQN